MASTQPWHSLPPARHHLPSWTRPSLQGKPGCTVLKMLPRDPVVPTRVQLSREKDPGLVTQLERNISFLRSQHSQTLEQLHTEMEKLKRENKELNFKLVMCRCGQKSEKTSRSRNLQCRKFHSLHDIDDTVDTSGEDELRPYLLEEELLQCKNVLHDDRQGNARLAKMKARLEQPDAGSSEMGGNGGRDDKLTGGHGSPTLSECREIIARLQDTIQQQNHELLQLKADLQDLLYSDKWTPDAYLLARAYIPESSPEEKVNLPPVSVRKESKSLNDRAYQRLQSSVHLPALRPRPSIGAERHRKSRIMATQRARLFCPHSTEHVSYR